jgi:hypothetical protein
VTFTKSVACKTLAVAVGFAALVSPAYAGNRTNYPVSIDLTTNTAQGSLGSARNSLDLVQYIGCDTTGDVALQTSVLHCVAVDALGRTASCVFQPQAGYRTGPLDGLPMLSGNAYLSFTWDSSGNCTSVKVYPSSAFEPKKL